MALLPICRSLALSSLAFTQTFAPLHIKEENAYALWIIIILSWVSADLVELHSLFKKRKCLRFRQFNKEVHVEKSIKTPAEVIEVLKQNNLYEMTPEFSKVATILAVIPATSCSAERSFSGLRRLKTYLRNTMGQNRLNSLAVVSIERSYGNQVIVNSMNKIINTFGQRHGRKKFFF